MEGGGLLLPANKNKGSSPVVRCCVRMLVMLRRECYFFSEIYNHFYQLTECYCSFKFNIYKTRFLHCFHCLDLIWTRRFTYPSLAVKAGMEKKIETNITLIVF